MNKGCCKRFGVCDGFFVIEYRKTINNRLIGQFLSVILMQYDKYVYRLDLSRLLLVSLAKAAEGK